MDVSESISSSSSLRDLEGFLDLPLAGGGSADCSRFSFGVFD